MTPEWLIQERRTNPSIEASLSLIAVQIEQIATQVDDAMAVATTARDAARTNSEALARLTSAYEAHCADTSWLPEMRDELKALTGALRFMITMQTIVVWLSKAIIGLAGLLAAFVGLRDYVVPWLSTLGGHK